MSGMRIRTLAVAALLATAVTPIAAFAQGPGGSCHLKFRQVTSEELPGGLGQPYLDCTY